MNKRSLKAGNSVSAFLDLKRPSGGDLVVVILTETATILPVLTDSVLSLCISVIVFVFLFLSLSLSLYFCHCLCLFCLCLVMMASKRAGDSARDGILAFLAASSLNKSKTGW